jgi:hypothetical protein
MPTQAPGDDIFLKCREGYCLSEEAAASVAPGGRRLHQSNWSLTSNCADGHSGTLCAICLDGYTMQGGFCQPCGAGDDWAHWSRIQRPHHRFLYSRWTAAHHAAAAAAAATVLGARAVARDHGARGGGRRTAGRGWRDEAKVLRRRCGCDR